MKYFLAPFILLPLYGFDDTNLSLHSVLTFVNVRTDMLSTEVWITIVYGLKI